MSDIRRRRTIFVRRTSWSTGNTFPSSTQIAVRWVISALVLVFCFVVCGRFPTGVFAQELPLPLTLREAVATALARHPAIRVGEATVRAAQQRVRQQEAGYLPRGAYTYTLSRQQRPLTAAVGGVQIDGQEQQRVRNFSQLFAFHSTNFSLRQLLFDFGRTLDSIQAAIASVDANVADLDTTRHTVEFNVKQAYYGLLSAQHLLRVAEETIQQNTKHLENAQARFEVGVASRFDVTQAQVQVSTAELDYVTAQNNVDLGRETLREALGMVEPLTSPLVDTLNRQSVTVEAETAVRHAYANRPELQSLHAQQRAATERISSLKKEYLPSISGDAQYTWTGRAYPLQEGWTVGVTLTIPLFDSILTTAQIGEAQADMQGLVAQEEDLRQRIALEVRRSILELRRAEKSIRVSEQSEVQARENLSLAEGRYQVGVGNILEVTDAQTSLTSARANVIQSLYNYKTALAQLERAIGRNLE
ncbi:MAG: TolC family protein [Candidatus Binatia bacterium]